MFFLDRTVDIPAETGIHIVTRGKDVYISQFVDPYRDESGSLVKNRKRRIIGRPLAALNGKMYPNPAYYEIRGLPVPELNHAKAAFPGRKPAFMNVPGAISCSAFAFAAFTAFDRIGAYQPLVDSFGLEKAEQLIFLATVYASGKTSLAGLERLSITSNVLDGAEGLTSQGASRLMATLDSVDLRSFFQRWIPVACQNDAIAYDVTAFTTAAKNMREAEYGYTHDTVADEPLINFALFCNERTGIPVFFAHYFGSLNDKTNLQKVMATAKDRNLPDKVTLVMDRGMTSLTNLKFCTEENLRFIAGAPATISKVAENLSRIAASHIPIHNKFTIPSASGSDLVYGITEDWEWQGLKLKLHTYRSVDAYSQRAKDFVSSIEFCQRHIAEGKGMPDTGVVKPEALKCFDKKKAGRGWRYEYNEEKAQELMDKMGSFALFSSPELNLDARSALLLYRRREIDEASFDCLKNDLSGLPLNIHDENRLDGKFFVLFLALLIKKALLQYAGPVLDDLRKGYSYLVSTLEAHKCELREQEIQVVDPEKGKTLFDYTASMNELTKDAKAILRSLIDPEIARELGILKKIGKRQKTATKRK